MQPGLWVLASVMPPNKLFHQVHQNWWKHFTRYFKIVEYISPIIYKNKLWSNICSWQVQASAAWALSPCISNATNAGDMVSKLFQQVYQNHWKPFKLFHFNFCQSFLYDNSEIIWEGSNSWLEAKTLEIQHDFVNCQRL